ncbi:GMC family oxidoreductase N-terminal domain-containing protein [Streptomyces sp. NPDC058694]|uniref:GMC family oxidoreductase N-terminal domain-containing protein n=1 Tax=Streptomyces sp. NPDC058694 TaxID=3346603 RepID=UPI00366A4C32
MVDARRHGPKAVEAVPPLGRTETQTLAALFDTVVPPDDAPGGWHGGGAALLREHLNGFLDWAVPVLSAAIEAVDQAARDMFGSTFADLPALERAHVLANVLQGEELSAVDHAERADRPIDTVIELALQAYYGGTREPAGWQLTGFRPVPEGVEEIEPDPVPHVRPGALEPEYDVIVVGAGAGGGMAAAELAARGRRVLLVERSRPFSNAELRGNHLQGKRQQLHDVIAGPGRGSPRVLELADGSTRVLRGDGPGTDYGLVAMALGGGTRVWQAMSWRFLPQDFAMASTYGVPDRSTLVDWPFGYDELEPYYERAEWELGVSGDSASAAATRAPRRRAFPMPALRDNGLRAPYTEAATRLGWNACPIPFAINSVPRAGRAACVGCPQCVGHACPVDAKNGTHNTAIPRAIETGNCDLLMSTQVTEVLHDQRGHARGVRAFHVADGTVSELTIRARSIVVAAGAMETPRLLLASGLGNDWVGRNHHTHAAAGAVAAEAPVSKEYVGPGHCVATLDFVHAGGAPWGGGVIFDLPTMLPVETAAMGRASAASFGVVHKRWMRESPLPLGVLSMVQEIPHELSRVSVAPTVRDRFGMPVARLRGCAHEASGEAAEFIRERCVDWVTELGGQGISSDSYPGGSRGGEHSGGTVRMGADPARSAADPQGRLHGTANVFVADASLHPTNGGFNPGLTAMACALRVAALMP